MVSGGTQFVYSAGTASSTVVASGVEEYVEAGGTAAGTMISGGLIELINSSIDAGTMSVIQGGQ